MLAEGAQPYVASQPDRRASVSAETPNPEHAGERPNIAQKANATPQGHPADDHGWWTSGDRVHCARHTGVSAMSFINSSYVFLGSAASFNRQLSAVQVFSDFELYTSGHLCWSEVS